MFSSRTVDPRLSDDVIPIGIHVRLLPEASLRMLRHYIIKAVAETGFAEVTRFYSLQNPDPFDFDDPDNLPPGVL